MPAPRSLRRVAALLTASLAMVLTSSGALAAPNPAFGPVMRALKKTHVPVLLPTYVPVVKVYTGVVSVTRTAYEIDIAYVPNCHEATACHIGYVRGEAGKATAKLAGQKISLTKGLTGYFVTFRCGASCGDSTVEWKEKGHLYTFGLHAGALKDLRKMVNSAIANGPQ